MLTRTLKNSPKTRVQFQWIQLRCTVLLQLPP